MAQVIELPRRQVSGLPVAVPAVPAAPDRGPAVDEWGRDAALIDLLSPLARLRWNVRATGLAHLPDGGGLLVTNQRRFSMSPLFVAWALGRATGRVVRFAGRPDIAPVGPAMRRIGALLDDPAEVLGALRHGELVVVGAGSTGHPRHAGTVEPALVGTALAAGVPVVPVASTSARAGRGATARVGAPVTVRRSRRGPLADVELAVAVQRHLQSMLDGRDAANEDGG